MSEQSKALQLANLIEWTTVQQDLVDAADELRRLHVVNSELLGALKSIVETKALAKSMDQPWCSAASGMVRIAHEAILKVQEG